jgi:hypothetical protein
MITLFCLFIHFMEAMHDKHVIDDSGKSSVANRKWHVYDFLMWLSLYVGFAIADGWIWILAGGSARLLMLQVGLNKMRGLPATHLGLYGIDKFCNNVLGKRNTLIIKVALVIISILIELWLIYKVFA